MLAEALDDVRWREAMNDEYHALMENKTWHLVLPRSTRNIIDYKWVIASRKMLMAPSTSTKHV
jgi:hypothetical protein